MRTREQVIWDYVQAWLTKAENDLHVAEILLASKKGYNDIAAFHCQQAVEKFQKALLVRHQIEFPKSHDLARLRALISQVDIKLAEEIALTDWLTTFGVETRYPSEVPELERETAERAIACAKEAGEMILRSLADYLPAGRPQG